jgi:lactate dehydrogenase-like 2-hydroxyacid dehydrogenase
MTDIIMMGPMHPAVEEGLKGHFTIHKLWEADDKNAFLSQVGNRIRGVATSGHMGCPREVLTHLPNVEIIASYGVGYDAIDTEDCRARGIKVTNTPDVLTDAMAEITLGLMIALARRIPQADRYVREGRWEKEGDMPLFSELNGKTLGIYGLGRIGKEVARRAQAFRMRVVYHGRSEQPHEPYVYYPDLVAMAREVDWLVSIVPGGASTRHRIDRGVIDALGPDGMLVNVGRGSTVDEKALIAALQEGRLGGAALDVFEEEPKVPEAFFGMDNVVLSPHQGSATKKTRQAMGQLVVDNLKAHFAGRPVLTPVA